MLQFQSLKSISFLEQGITETLDTPPADVTFGEQVHKDAAMWVNAVSKNPIPRVDALVTRETGLAIGVRIADCVPVLFVEPRLKIVGAVHAGWRGTALDISRKTIEFLKIKPFGVRVGVGPAICPNCFVVGEEVARQFDPVVVKASDTEEGKFHVDLWQANVLQLVEAGVQERNIEVIRVCTNETPNLYSFRRGDRDQRNVAFIKIK